ncbi:MAG: hypothetical protein JF887_10165, partial [Candidatus Dormibacteraeota bacterium]|nr:hypothetical protein [Candidatus Dormibacteraeota bacterium]
MSARTPDSDDDAVTTPEDAPEEGAAVDDVAEPEVSDEVIEVDVVGDVEVVADDDADEDEEEEEEKAEVVVVAPVRPTPRPQPGRPPSAKEEEPPPFAIGERVRLTSNIRPRTGTPIGDYPVGSIGSVETVLSQTAIVRFDRAPETKEVVAWTCLETAEGVAGRGDGPPVPPAPAPLRRATAAIASHPVAVLRGVPRPPAPRELPPPAPARLAPAGRPASTAAAPTTVKETAAVMTAEPAAVAANLPVRRGSGPATAGPKASTQAGAKAVARPARPPATAAKAAAKPVAKPAAPKPVAKPATPKPVAKPATPKPVAKPA